MLKLSTETKRMLMQQEGFASINKNASDKTVDAKFEKFHKVNLADLVTGLESGVTTPKELQRGNDSLNTLIAPGTEEYYNYWISVRKEAISLAKIN